MHKTRNKLMAIFLICIVCVGLLAGCSRGTARQGKSAGTITITIGTHAQKEIDPNWRDPITGEPFMTPDELRAAEAALAKVKEELNVEIEFLQYPQDVSTILLQSVLAGDPVCDLAILWNGIQGTILGQNVLQPLDEYADIFLDDPEGQWILNDKIFGHYYLMNRDLLFVKTWPLVYNINYIEAVDSLKENGRTVYPSDLYERGEWTWSKFEEYLTKIQAYYNGKMAPVRTNVPIKAFQTDYTYAALMALHSVGECLFNGTDATFDTPEAKRAMEYIDRLMNKGLMMSVNNSGTINPGWLWNSNDFGNGETVFTNVARWLAGTKSKELASRGQSMGIIPWPRPDDYAVDDPRYQHLSAFADSVGLLKGISKEKSRLALEAYKLYKNTYYKTLARVDTMEEYMKQRSDSEALLYGIDIFHEHVGEANRRIFYELGIVKENEMAESLGIQSIWGINILGESIYGVNGSPKYAIAVEAEKNTVFERLDVISKAISSEEVVDNIAPGIKKSSSKPIAFPVGTDPSTIDWGKIFEADDNIDGKFSPDQIQIDVSATDFNTIGKYSGGVVAKVVDSAGNEASTKQDVIIYDPHNTVPPTLVIKEEYPAVKLDDDASAIDWGGKYIDKAEDVNGNDVKANVSADLSYLDVTTPGEYPVEITVTDFAGNKTSQTIMVKVEK